MWLVAIASVAACAAAQRADGEGGYFAPPTFARFGAPLQRPLPPTTFTALHGGLAFHDGATMHHAHQDAGYARGETQARNGMANAAAYRAAEGRQQAAADGDRYEAAQRAHQQGRAAGEQQRRQGHQNGHVVNGYKTSHRKDEAGRTEEYYDEARDEGGHFAAQEAAGAFGEAARRAYEGGRNAGHFRAGDGSQQGHAERAHRVDNASADRGDYAREQSFGRGQSHDASSDVHQQSILGHQESNRFFTRYPTHAPFYMA